MRTTEKPGRKIGLFAAIGICAAAYLLRKYIPKANDANSLQEKRLHQKALAKLNPTEITTRRYMIYFVIPVWIGAGLLDWYWHRKTKIETTAGKKESGIHALMMTEVGIPVLAALFLEINAGVLLLMLAAFAVHEATAMWDVAYASEHRDVKPREQHTHSFLELLPFCAVSFMIILHWDQFRSLWGAGDTKPDFTLRWKEIPLSRQAIVRVLAAVAGGIALPYGEEYFRCVQAERLGLAGTDTPGYVRERVYEKEHGQI